MTSSNNVFCDAGMFEDGFIELRVPAVAPPAILALGSPGAAIYALPFRTLGGSVIDLDLLAGLVSGDPAGEDIQPIFAFASRGGMIRSFGKELPRQAIQDACVESFATLLSVEDIV